MLYQFFLMPIVYYLAILILFLLYFIVKGKKRTIKQNILFILLCMMLLLVIHFEIPKWELHYFLNAFHSDSVVIESEGKNLSVPLDHLFAGERGAFFKEQDLGDILNNLHQKPYARLYFYQDGKQRLALSIYSAKQKNSYVHNVNGKSIVILYNNKLIDLPPCIIFL